MPRTRTLAPYAGLLAVLLGGIASGTTAPNQAPQAGSYVLRVHVLEGKNFKPRKGVLVSIDQPPFPTGQKAVYIPMVKTGRDGVAVFRLPSPPLPAIYVSSLDQKRTCSQFAFCTQDLIARGEVPTDACWPVFHKSGQREPSIKATPGDVYIFEHHINRFVWGWYETFGSAAGPFVHFPRRDTNACPPVTAPPNRPPPSTPHR